MKRILAAALLLAVSILPFTASAKTCKCENHKAEATGQGTCSLTETPDLCSVTFTIPVADAQSPASSVFEQNFKVFADSNVQFENYSFASQNAADFQFKPVMGSSLATLALSSIPTEVVESLRPEFATLFAAGSPRLQSIAEDYNSDGCVDVREGDLRILIIAWQSEKNGRCE
jgi:hypothetical protein